MHPSRFLPFRSSRLSAATVTLLLLAAPAEAFRWPWETDPWPDTSLRPVAALDHPVVESVFPPGAAASYRFAVFGDQRALADGEWQRLVERIAALRDDERPAFVLDTGDIVDDGSHSDQFWWLRDILHPLRDLPYLVGVGNHEVADHGDPAARANTAAFLAYLDRDLSPERLWYRKDIGPAAFLFLDTNDFTYGADGDRDECPPSVEPATREGRQVAWLREQAADLGAKDALVIAVMHHPLVQSSEKHRPSARTLWAFTDGGQTLVDLLVDAGVDVVLTGHTHTFERFRLVRDDGRSLHLVNISGRPRDAFLWIGAGERRARDIRGEETAFLEEAGWTGLERWKITQEELMRKEGEADQFALFSVEEDGGLTLEMRFLDDEEPDGMRHGAPVRLR
ncbi:MAG: metallophosphoesterase family protein [Candidatus Eiseniibacteriota bacterium]